jgi:hypothetical protein
MNMHLSPISPAGKTCILMTDNVFSDLDAYLFPPTQPQMNNANGRTVNDPQPTNPVSVFPK